MKQCPKCKIPKLREEFPKESRKKDGLHPYCRSCTSIVARTNNVKKRKWYDEYKKGLKCQNCDESHIACLEFHHRSPEEKGFSISQSISKKGVEQIIDEIAKCDVLCANCHRKLHYNLKNEGDRK